MKRISGDGVRVAQPLFPVEGQGSIPMSPLQLNIIEIGILEACGLNKLWHSRVPIITNPYSKNRIAFGAEFKGIWYAVALWTDPIARGFNHRGYLELRRMAIAPDSPKYTASRMIKIMALLIKRAFPHINKLISYQDTGVHTGTIYRASGWDIGGIKANIGTGWNTRLRNKMQTASDKIRWEKQIRPEPEQIDRVVKCEDKQMELFAQ
ncbi:hypothetical protein LCGC14_1865790 [marine sediment metagenome]|uniref:Uncharacterized protein n=2 Tax=root TaxID=1 RepID=A0A831QIS7_9FLAO|nr:hypothetical protein [Pricia antarctica]